MQAYKTPEKCTLLIKLYVKMTLNCKGKLIDISSPKVMGILNITPDSFFDGGNYKNESDILHKLKKCFLKVQLL